MLVATFVDEHIDLDSQLEGQLFHEFTDVGIALLEVEANALHHLDVELVRQVVLLLNLLQGFDFLHELLLRVVFC